jgi:hypothetical protein
MLPYLKQDFPDITLGMAAVSLLLIQENQARLVWFMMLFVNSCTGKSFRWRSVKICG